MDIEQHPFEPFLPANAQVLFLGSFPPQPKRWSMKFYYPNYTNDFWWMCGKLWYADKNHFAIPSERRFDLDKIIAFCEQTGIALYDTATAVRRLKDNASDKFLEVVTPTDIPALLRQIPQCKAIVTTGQKATDVLCERFGCEKPSLGTSVSIKIPFGDGEVRTYDFFRMPSTSRAYPLSLDKKAEAYLKMFRTIGLLP